MTSPAPILLPFSPRLGAATADRDASSQITDRHFYTVRTILTTIRLRRKDLLPVGHLWALLRAMQ